MLSGRVARMGIGKLVGGAVAGLGVVGLGYAGIAGQDNTTRDESGAIISEGEVGAFRIQLGDCLNGLSGGLVESVEGVPCSEPHSEEVYHAFNLDEGDGTFPGDEVVGTAADEGCYAAFEPFVGTTFEESEYGFSSLTPSEESWDELDDREVLCLIANYDGTPKTGSAEGTAK
jgi:hypothetical protein